MGGGGGVERGEGGREGGQQAGIRDERGVGKRKVCEGYREQESCSAAGLNI